MLASVVWLSAQAQSYDLVVAQDGSGDCTTIAEMVAALPDYLKEGEFKVLIKSGIYREKVQIPRSKQRIRFIGEPGTVISWGDYALKNNALGVPMGTSATATVFIDGSDLVFEQITFENTAGEGAEIAQAVAVLTTGSNLHFRSCRFLANQDTLYTMVPNSTLYFFECWIEGTTDFIFGASQAVFVHCTIHSKKNSYVTAASTPEGQKYGYVFYGCRLTADPGVTKVYLGRPWRPFARTVFIGCELGSHILPEGWHNWSKPDAEKTSYYAEYQSKGPGASPATRVAWSHQLTQQQANQYLNDLFPEK